MVASATARIRASQALSSTPDPSRSFPTRRRPSPTTSPLAGMPCGRVPSFGRRLSLRPPGVAAALLLPGASSWPRRLRHLSPVPPVTSPLPELAGAGQDITGRTQGLASPLLPVAGKTTPRFFLNGAVVEQVGRPSHNSRCAAWLVPRALAAFGCGPAQRLRQQRLSCGSPGGGGIRPEPARAQFLCFFSENNC
jgi:hypothetical protein